MRKIAHIINPTIVSEESDLFIAQPITFATMQHAQAFAKEQIDVQLYTAQYSEDHPLVPEGFRTTPDLERSVLDFGSFAQQRKLPLIKDILDRLYAVSDADYFIYTNVDIALQPHFYLAVNQIIEQGIDAFVINRRSIPTDYQRPAQIPLMYAQVGTKHGGHDCFVFPRAAYPRYRLGKTCIGMSRIGAVLLVNLFYNATRFQEFTDENLTFHLGDDQVWRDNQFHDYLIHNHQEWQSILAHYHKQDPERSSELIEAVTQRCSRPYFPAQKPSSLKYILRYYFVYRPRELYARFRMMKRAPSKAYLAQIHLALRGKDKHTRSVQ